MTARLIDRDIRPEDSIDTHLRPQTLDQFVGRSKVKQNLKVFIEAAKSRGGALDRSLRRVDGKVILVLKELALG